MSRNANFAAAPAGSTEHLSTAWVQVSDPVAVLAAARRHGLAMDGEGFRLAGMRFVPVASAL